MAERSRCLIMNSLSKNKHSDFYTSHLEEGFDIRYAENLWTTTAKSELRLELLTNLDRMGIGLGKVESYMEGLVVEFRSKKFRGKGAKLGKKVIRESMVLKLHDEREVHKELDLEKSELRRETERLFGKNSRRQRRLIKHLRQEASRTKKEEKQKYDTKAVRLNKKWSREETGDKDTVPTELIEYKNAKVFTLSKFEDIKEDTVEVTTYGKATISEEEKSALKLQPKFAVLRKL